MFPTFLSFTEHHPRYVALVGFSFFIIGLVLYGFQYRAEQKANAPLTENVVEIQQTFPVPRRTDFGTTTPSDFIGDIPLEDGAVFSQSYSLEYPEEMQLSVVFMSLKTGKENYTLYADFLKEQNWMVINTYEGDGLFSLYAVKENRDINVTVHEDATDASITSQVSISIIKK